MDNSALSLHSTNLFIRNQELFSTQIDEETVMLDEEAGLYFALNPVASFIWEQLVNPMSLQALISVIVANYDVSIDQCQQDVMLFLTELLEKKLIILIP